MKKLSFPLLCRMKKKELQPLWRLEEFRELLAIAAELPREKLKCRLLSFLSPEEREKAGALTLSAVLLKVWQSFFADTVPVCLPDSLAEGVLSLCQKYSWSPDRVLELPYPVFVRLLDSGPVETPPVFTEDELAAAKARLLSCLKKSLVPHTA